jgi:hypothetical protein
MTAATFPAAKEAVVPKNDRNEKFPRGRRIRPNELRGDDFYYGGARTQRQDWEQRAWDFDPRDRREGMYAAGGRDFEERMDEAYLDPDGRILRDRSWWATHNPVSGKRPWYETERDERTRFTGGDHGWSDRRHRFLRGVKNFFGVGPKGYKRSDERIREDVCEALADHPDVDASEIEVRVRDGEVILTGTVESRWMKRQAEDAVEFVPGVRDVRVELTIPRNTDDTGELDRGRTKKPA